MPPEAEFESCTLEASTGGPHLLITAGVHGDEFAPMQAVRRLATLLGDRLRRGRITLVPLVNAAAFRRGSRCADDGLDLARTLPGNAAGSYTQRLAWALDRLIRQADYYIDLHTGGTAFRLAFLAGYILHADRRVLAEQRAMARAFGAPLVWGTSPEWEGRTLSTARDACIPAIYVEHGGGSSYEPQAVQDLVQGCVNVAAYLGLLAGGQTPTVSEYLVEDYRPGSGHLQAQHPAPADGFFEPVVEVMQPVAAGQPLGYITDALGTRCVQVQAEAAGRVLFVRVHPPVRQGESVGGILPVPGPGVYELR
ncbi:MAG: succinylglutamate desuccinylase/aspartoacylase family protein [Pirellulales bacterium]|nr:succinylglutamate desuccinylase/aspartoacylase family protein [Pirellulales bacterium]